jgi:hypothetical protein
MSTPEAALELLINVSWLLALDKHGASDYREVQHVQSARALCCSCFQIGYQLLVVLRYSLFGMHNDTELDLFSNAGVKQNFETRWIGWPGLYVPDEAGRKSLQKALADKVKERRIAISLRAFCFQRPSTLPRINIGSNAMRRGLGLLWLSGVLSCLVHCRPHPNAVDHVF